MEKQFWFEKWAKRQIGFHEPAPNGLLVEHFDALGLDPGQRVFLPLCGKTLDIGWLLAKGHPVVGAELSQMAVEELFDELKVTPQVAEAGALKRFSAPDLDVFVGDFFELEPEHLGQVHAVYDRAAYVAMSPQMRADYAAQLRRVAPQVPQLLITFEYDQNLMEGPPFAVHQPDIHEKYSGHFRIQGLARKEIEGGFKGKVPAAEAVWLLHPGQ